MLGMGLDPGGVDLLAQVCGHCVCWRHCNDLVFGCRWRGWLLVLDCKVVVREGGCVSWCKCWCALVSPSQRSVTQTFKSVLYQKQEEFPDPKKRGYSQILYPTPIPLSIPGSNAASLQIVRGCRKGPKVTYTPPGCG